MFKLFTTVMVMVGFLTTAQAAIPTKKISHKTASKTSKSQKLSRQTSQKTHSKPKEKYDFSNLNKLPFTYTEIGEKDAEFYITDKPSDTIQQEIDRVKGSLSEVEYTSRLSYEPRYISQRPQSATQKRSYLVGYLKILEEAI